MNSIHILDEKTVNQIAAGEVVERPASVVKELVENALDAGATSISVEILEGGLKLIKVSDNGDGMGLLDAQNAVQNHATSKIRSADDLSTIHTFGFRGEALASISAVSHFELSTQTEGSDTGCTIQVRGGSSSVKTPASRPHGTSVSVSNLFFNTPARLKFMKKPSTENDRAALVVTTYALANPSCGFKLTVDGRTLLDSPPGTPESRRRDIFGRDLSKHLLPIQYEAGPIAITGAVTAPAITKPTRESLFLFVNGRWIMNPALGHAVLTAYQTLLPSRRFPAGVLFIHLPTDEVDVNIHPTKREVKFVHDRAVYDAVVQAVRRTLLDSPLDIPGGSASNVGMVPETPYGVIRQTSTAQSQEPMPTGLWGAASSSPTPFNRNSSTSVFPPLGHAASGVDMNARRIDPELPLYNFMQYFNTFIVFQSDSELFIADQHTVHERLNFEKILKSSEKTHPETQPLLIPVTVDLPAREAAFLSDNLSLLESLGLEVAPFGGNTFAIKAVPSDLAGKDPGVLVKELADQVARDETTGVRGEDVLAQRRRRVAAYLSCRSAVMAGDRLNEEQMKSLINRMRNESIPFTCPHGRPTLMSIPLSDLYRKFDRH
jgi:DNA mismatch repair protein MutL